MYIDHMSKRNLSKSPILLETISIFLGMVAITTLSHVVDEYIGLAGVSFLYLILVILVSYKSQLATSIFVAIGSFLLINFFYVEPRYTFVIGSVESWSALLGFLMVSIAITSLVHQLRQQKDIAEKETFKANLLRAIIEIFSVETDSIVTLQKFCLLLKSQLGCEVAILKLDSITKDSIELASSKAGEVKLDPWYLSHALEYGAMLGPHTGTLEAIDYWCVPFGRFYKSHELPALVIERAHEENIEVSLIRAIADQLSIHYQKRMAEIKAKDAGELAHRESIQKAFLSSISHDMRTPLTTIIGASSSLLKQSQQLGESQSKKLLELIHSESVYLNDSTENILSLVKLGTSDGNQLRMDWQSPEEIVGAVISRYNNREVKPSLALVIEAKDELIYGDQALIVLALTNLIENANKAHLGSKPIQILVDRVDDEIRIGVIDEGAGFPEDFDKGLAGQQQFYQRNKKGFGLGISIVRAVMDKHEGRLVIEPSFGGDQRTYVGMAFPFRAST
jgi:two-component system sensor histidine kinase KdpD